MWTVLSSSLIIGSDLSVMDEYTVETLTNEEVIALKQDPLAIQASRVRKDGDIDVFAKPLHGGDWAAAVLNRCLTSTEFEHSWQGDLGVAWTRASVRDPWDHRDMGEYSDGFAATVESHVAMMLRASPT
jgi:alpha-galactosidase